MTKFNKHPRSEFETWLRRVSKDVTDLRNDMRRASTLDRENPRAAVGAWNDVEQWALDGSGAFAHIELIARCNREQQHETGCFLAKAVAR